MKKLLSISLSVILVLSLTVTFTSGTLADDSPSDWARETVTEAISLGLVPQSMQGAYTAPATREEFCDTLILLLNKVNADLAKTDANDVFSDTDNENVSALYSLGVVTGMGEGKFNPGGGISRQEAAAILTRGAKVLGKNVSYNNADFADGDAIADWAAEGVNFTAGSGIMQGTGIGFEPLGVYTREQTIATILRLYKLVGEMPIPTASKKDLDSSWDSPEGTIVLDGETIIAEGTGVSADGNVAAITTAGTYVVNGTLIDGQIIVNAAKDEHVRLVLNGASITNKSGAPIYAVSCDKLVVILADGTQNTLTDGGDSFIYANEADEEPNAALFCKDDLTINGMGSLIVNAGFNNGIGTKDDLVIVGGNITVTAANHGLRGNDSVAVYGGTLNINAESDGIQTSNAEDAGKGWIYIADGNFTIKSANDGIQAETDLTIAGGTFDIKSGGGAAAAPVRQEGFGGIGGQWPQNGATEGERPQNGERPQRGMEGNQLTPRGERPQDENRPMDGWGENQIPPGRETTPSDTEDTVAESKKAIKTGGNLVINGGVFIIDAEDDGVHSDQNLTVNGGGLTVQSGDDGVHATNALIINNGDIRITKSYEGLEGSTVDINGGNIYADASDDALNAAGGADSATGRGGMGQPGGDRFSQIESHYIRITGGVLDVHDGTDGIDSNGNIFLDGGTVYVSGQSMGMEGALDFDGTLTITGGTLITAGSVTNPSQSSAQASLIVSYTTQNAVGSIITIKDASGNTIAEYTSRISFTASGFTSPKMADGQTYSVWVNNEKRLDVTLSGAVTSIAENGGTYNIRGMKRMFVTDLLLN